MRTLAALALSALALVSGCSGGGSEEATTTSASAASAQASDQFQADDSVGAALRRFVDAAAAGDGTAMWALLSTRSREQLGPTQAEFADLAADLERGLGSFGGTPYRTVLSVKTASGWGVAAVAGGRIRRGDAEFAAYGAALRLERGEWRIELGDPVDIVKNQPPETTADRQPRVQFELGADAPVEEAGLWLDGVPLPATAGGTADAVTLVATPATPLEPGWHVLVVFVRAGDDASAGATPFEVEAGEKPTIVA